MPLNNSQIEESFYTSDEDVKVLLFNILNLNLHYDSSQRAIVNTINKLLSVSKTRSQGLEFLNLIINNCCKIIISDNALNWVSHCIVKYSDDNLKEAKLLTIGTIVENAYSEQEFSKRFVSDHISKVLESCISKHGNLHESEAGLQTLQICMKHYGSWFAPHRGKIETFIINCLENPSDSLVEKAALAFLYLQQTGGAGAEGVNHRNNFSTSFSKTCTTLQKLFNTFFENEIEIEQNDTATVEGFQFVNLSYSSQKMLHVTAKRITNCLKFLSVMLLKNFPVSKDIKPIEVLDIISRGTALHHCVTTEKEKSLEDYQYSLLLNKVQIELVRLLKILIIWLRENALPFSFTISKALMDCLKKVQNCQCFIVDNLYQEVVYKVMKCWISIAKSAFHAHFQTEFVSCILKDITPVRVNVTLNLQTNSAKSPKAKRKFIQERLTSTGLKSTSEKMTATEKANNETNCLLALDTLKQLLYSTTLRIKSKLLWDLYNPIINAIVEIQSSKYTHPYTNADCQAKLYEVLVAFYEQETLSTLPPIHHTINILNKGTASKNRHIALTCERGLSILEKLCQPICPSLYIPEMFPSKENVQKPEVFDSQVVNDIAEQNVKDGEDRENLGLNLNLEVVNDDSMEKEIHQEELVHIGESIEEDNVVLTNWESQNGTNMYQKDSRSSHTLVKENSIHIIDVQIVKTLESSKANGNAEDMPSLSHATKETEVKTLDKSITTESEILKVETPHNINSKPSENKLIEEVGSIEENKSDGSPSLKRSRSDDVQQEEHSRGHLIEENANPSNKEHESEGSPSLKKSKLDDDQQQEHSEGKDNQFDQEQETEESPSLGKNQTDDVPVVEVDIKEEPVTKEEMDDVFEEDGFVDEIKDY